MKLFPVDKNSMNDMNIEYWMLNVFGMVLRHLNSQAFKFINVVVEFYPLWQANQRKFKIDSLLILEFSSWYFSSSRLPYSAGIAYASFESQWWFFNLKAKSSSLWWFCVHSWNRECYPKACKAKFNRVVEKTTLWRNLKLLIFRWACLLYFSKFYLLWYY